MKNKKYFIRDHLKAFDNALSKGYNLDGVMYMESLRELHDKRDTFGRIKIPDFTYGRYDDTIWYVSDYVKGKMLNESDMRSIVWKECVLREDTFSLLNYDRTSYIRCSNNKEIYYIDLNDCGQESIDMRKERFWNTKSRI